MLLSSQLSRSSLLGLLVFAQLVITCLGFYMDMPLLAGALPLLLGGIWLTTSSYRTIYSLLFLLLPFSMEVLLPGGIGIDFPTEFLLLFITFIGILSLIREPQRLSIVGFLLLLHLGWGWISALGSDYLLIAIKFMLAKVWFVVPFFFFMPFVVRSWRDFDGLLKVLVGSVVLLSTYTFIRHGFLGWSFDQRMYAGAPFLRNHVNYACLLLLTLPVCYYLFAKYRQRVFLFLGLLLLFFLYFAYARIAYVAIAMGVFSIVALRLRLLPLVVAGGLALSIFGTLYFLQKDTLIHLAPDYQRTISHSRFDDMMDATYELQDISTMERLYRWVAGWEMAKEKPLIGHGPSNFYPKYQQYAINSFQTYVSDNPERSGIHNYYLMLIVEQGFIGLLLYLLLIVVALFIAQAKYSHSDSREVRLLLQLATAWIIIIATINLLNDMVEVIKVGPFLFLALYIIARTTHNKKGTFVKFGQSTP